MRRVIVVEDNRDLAQLARRIIKTFFPEIICETHTFISDKMFDPDFWKGVDVLISDLMMDSPRSGTDLVKFVHERLPGIKIIVISAALESFPEAANYADVLLRKPASIDELLEALQPGGRDGRT